MTIYIGYNTHKDFKEMRNELYPTLPPMIRAQVKLIQKRQLLHFKPEREMKLLNIFAEHAINQSLESSQLPQKIQQKIQKQLLVSKNPIQRLNDALVLIQSNIINIQYEQQNEKSANRNIHILLDGSLLPKETQQKIKDILQQENDPQMRLEMAAKLIDMHKQERISQEIGDYYTNNTCLLEKLAQQIERDFHGGMVVIIDDVVISKKTLSKEALLSLSKEPLLPLSAEILLPLETPENNPLEIPKHSKEALCVTKTLFHILLPEFHLQKRSIHLPEWQPETQDQINKLKLLCFAHQGAAVPGYNLTVEKAQKSIEGEHIVKNDTITTIKINTKALTVVISQPLLVADMELKPLANFSSQTVVNCIDNNITTTATQCV